MTRFTVVILGVALIATSAFAGIRFEGGVPYGTPTNNTPTNTGVREMMNADAAEMRGENTFESQNSSSSLSTRSSARRSTNSGGLWRNPDTGKMVNTSSLNKWTNPDTGETITIKNNGVGGFVSTITNSVGRALSNVVGGIVRSVGQAIASIGGFVSGMLESFSDFLSVTVAAKKDEAEGGGCGGGGGGGGGESGGGSGGGGSGGSSDPGSSCESKAEPLTLDFSNDHVQAVDILDSNIYFDYNTGAGKIRTSWYAPGEYILAIDYNNNEKIDNIDEVFGNQYMSGFEELGFDIDANKDGIVDNRDPKFADLLIWHDRNGNAVSEFGELRPLSDYRVTSINMKNRKTIEVYSNKQRVSHESYATLEGGREVRVFVTWFRKELPDGSLPINMSEERISQLAMNKVFSLNKSEEAELTGEGSDFDAGCDAPSLIFVPPGIPCTEVGDVIPMCVIDGEGGLIPKEARVSALQEMGQIVGEAMESSGINCVAMLAYAEAKAKGSAGAEHSSYARDETNEYQNRLAPTRWSPSRY